MSSTATCNIQRIQELSVMDSVLVLNIFFIKMFSLKGENWGYL